MIATGAFVVLGAVLIVGAASLAALLAGYEPPGLERPTRRLRQRVLEYRPDLSKAAEAWEPVGKRIAEGERMVRDTIRSRWR